jgi:hypothetical protein
MNASGRRLLWALGISAALHLVALVGTRIELPQPEPDKPLTVKLEALPQPLPPKPAAVKPRRSPSPKIHTPIPEPRAPAPAEPSPAVAETAPAPAAVAGEPATEPAPPPKPLTPLPQRIRIVYVLYKGDQQLNVGRMTHTWQMAGNQYTLTSVAEATGLFSLFVRGTLIQFSRGELAAEGLKPAEFWIQRGQSGNRTESASFDYTSRQLRYGRVNEQRSQPLVAGTQDVLSVLYQLALTAPHAGTLDLAVTNGRKFDHYVFHVEGEDMLETPLGSMKTQHLAKADADGSRLDVWLGADIQYLPVRLRITDKNGDSAEQVATSIGAE